MNIMPLDEYERIIKQERAKWFISPYDLAYDTFVKLGYDKQNADFFIRNASTIIENMRSNCWVEFQKTEKEFTTAMLKMLIDDTSEVNNMTAMDAIAWFVESFPNHIYKLTLSNTQSRRSRAGKEFECILELVLLGASIRADSQGNIGKSSFIKKGLGKLVDIVSPGVTEYTINKRDTILISAKTTLRERWQEVPEEMSRTGAREMFLATLDDSISSETLDTLYEANIQVTTTKSIKDLSYSSNVRVLDFEDLISIIISNDLKWSSFDYSESQRKYITENLSMQAEKHKDHDFVHDYYIEKLKSFVLDE